MVKATNMVGVWSAHARSSMSNISSEKGKRFWHCRDYWQETEHGEMLPVDVLRWAVLPVCVSMRGLCVRVRGVCVHVRCVCVCWSERVCMCRCEYDGM